MKASEINVGQDYAIERFGGSFYRARVVAVGDVVGESRGTGMYGMTRGHKTVTKRATVRFLRNDGTEFAVPKDETVALNKVTMTWPAYVEAHNTERARQERFDFALSEVEARCDALLGRERVVWFARRDGGNGTYAGTASVRATVLSELLDAAYEAGRSSAVTS